MKKSLVVYPESAKKALKHDYKKVLELIVTEEFQTIVKRLRKECNIPEIGFTYQNDRLGKGYMLWMNQYGKKYRRIFMSTIGKICLKGKLSVYSWEGIIRDYIVTGLLIPVEEVDENGSGYAWGTCYVDDLVSYQNTGLPIVELNETHPIALRISPYASKNDIADYVEKSFSEIAEIQGRYKGIVPRKIYRNRGEVLRKRNEFIDQHRELSLNEIAEKLSIAMDISLSESDISKILSLQRKRRKKLITSI